MTKAALETTYECLDHLDEVDKVESAQYRQQALDVLADNEIDLQWRQAIADRLNEADVLLGMTVVGKNDDSY
ncbi:hypothetical protein IQ266_09755 [filamentous cyanobacterium LEGE 11480]|uniref:Uncharacterized protein n=1 Tax=Romeriopsis navalis LEGE 11480 TaxID=2777977 RepID=A0A928VNL3_9CYAN|nr:hypothetical protein [Romeriopsis navalis]MBE9030011.1 hypothetical protein [Romeriopsis navalis LEGE 11480]